ncbi:MAG: antibiotic biosynthesis monooxygenase [Planctomycetota bacterium]|jgi:quinol monooxygenase YgiN
MNTRGLLIATVGSGLVLLGGLTSSGRAQERPQPAAQPRSELPDLMSGLQQTPGCLGIELARTQSGKNVIFAWFENKQAVLGWYYSEMHQRVVDEFFAEHDETHRPLAGVPDDVGPIMAIASVTMSDAPRFKETTLPVSQIAIELYKPVTGGLFLGGRFAPETVKVREMRDYTPKEEGTEAGTKGLRDSHWEGTWHLAIACVVRPTS